jgi:hypothetical protein
MSTLQFFQFAKFMGSLRLFVASFFLSKSKKTEKFRKLKISIRVGKFTHDFLIFVYNTVRLLLKCIFLVGFILKGSMTEGNVSLLRGDCLANVSLLENTTGHL